VDENLTFGIPEVSEGKKKKKTKRKKKKKRRNRKEKDKTSRSKSAEKLRGTAIWHMKARWTAQKGERGLGRQKGGSTPRKKLRLLKHADKGSMKINQKRMK